MAVNLASDDCAAGVKIAYQPKEVWDFYNRNQEALEDTQGLIAENADTNYEVYVTDDYGFPAIMVYRGDELEYEECVLNEQDCVQTVTQIYMKYLFPVEVVSGLDLKSSAIADGVDANLDNGELDECLGDDSLTEDEWHAYAKDMEAQSAEESEQDDIDIAKEDEIYLREDELLYGLYDFLDIVLDGKTQYFFDSVYDEEFNKILDEILLTIACHGLSVRRPTLVESDDGAEAYIEYPYEEADDAKDEQFPL